MLGGGDWHSLWTGAHVLVTAPPQRAETSLFSTRCAWVPVRRPLLMESGWLHAGHGGCHHSLVAGKCFSFSPAKLPGFLGKKVQPQGAQESLGWGPGWGQPDCGRHSWSGTDLLTGLHPSPNHPSSLQPSNGFACSFIQQLIHLGIQLFPPFVSNTHTIFQPFIC